MQRPVALALLAVVVGAATLFVVQRRAGSPPVAPATADNPAGFVPSDVARLASTGRPQVVEFFHYG